MKRTSINLEDDLLAFIDEYQKQYNLSSRSVTIQRIIAKFQHIEPQIELYEMLLKRGVSVKNNKDNDVDNKKAVVVEPEKEKKELSEKDINLLKSVNELEED